MDIKKDILWRVYLCFLGMILLGVVVLAKAFYIQRVQGSYWKKIGDSMHIKSMPIDAERGSIYSEDGNILSMSVPIFDVRLDFGGEGVIKNNGKNFKDNLDSLSICLADLFKDKKASDYKKELLDVYKGEERYYLLKRKISFAQRQSLLSFPFIRLGQNKSGFKIEQNDKRINPYVLLANRTIGLSREESSKNIGLERTYDDYLKGTMGQKLVRYQAGVYMPIDGSEVEPENGKDIITTLDTYMQDVAETALMKMLVGNNSLHGTAIVMETATGKIKAIANLGKRATDTAFTEDLNYGIARATEPGSIFKLATLLCLIEDKYADINSIVDCEGGTKQFYGLKIRDSHQGTGRITLKEAFFRSSNVAFAKLADQFYHTQPSKFINHLHQLRLDTMTGVDIVAASGRPTIKKPSNRSWANTTIPFMAHGYEELVTPLHMLMLYNAVANNGRMMKPYLVNAVREYGIDIKNIEPQVLVEKICSNETLQQLKECLAAVVDSVHGTAHKVVFDSAYSIAGKTGTAVTALNNKGYNKGNKIYQASFIGYFPAQQPKYTIAVVIQNSNQSKLVFGADVSGKVFKEISDKIYGRYLSNLKYSPPLVTDTLHHNYYGSRTDINVLQNLIPMYKDASVIGLNEIPVNVSDTLPALAGMGLKDAVDVLENMGLKVAIKGKGRVVNQSLPVGSTIKKGQRISIILN